MIEKKVQMACRKCGSIEIVRNGTDYKDSQKFLCKSCDFSGTLEPKISYSEEKKFEILRTYQERSSLRGLHRIFGVAVSTVQSWIRNLADYLPGLEKTLSHAHPDDILELDELWSFVYSKDNVQYVWIALCRRTRQVVAYYIGDRSEASCRELYDRIPEQYKERKSFSDFWKAYDKVFPNNTSVGKETGETAHVERWNNTLRQRLGRFTRKTLSFSKSEWYHEMSLLFFLVIYNLSLIS